MSRIRRMAAVAAAGAMTVGLAGCEPPETWWPTVLDGPEVQSPRTTAIVGDFDEDGLDDIYWYEAGSTGAAEELWTARPEGGFDRTPAPSVTGRYDPVAGDFDGDGDDDILWTGVQGGGSVWTFEAGAVAQRRTIGLPASYDASSIVVIERASGPDHVGMLMGEPGMGPPMDGLYIWNPLVADWTDNQLVDADGQALVRSGDFDGDGFGDVLTHGFGSRRDTIAWGRADGRYDSQAVTISGRYWSAVLDADGDGRDDVVFVPNTSGAATMPLWQGRPGRWFAKTTKAAPTILGDPWVQEDRGDGRANVWLRADGTDQIWELDAGGAAVVHTVTGPGLGIPVVGHFSDAARDDVFSWGYRQDRLYLSPQA